MKVSIIDVAYRHEGVRIYYDTSPTLNSRDYKEPKIVCFDENIPNIIRERHAADNSGGEQYDTKTFLGYGFFFCYAIKSKQRKRRAAAVPTK